MKKLLILAIVLIIAPLEISFLTGLTSTSYAQEEVPLVKPYDLLEIAVKGEPSLSALVKVSEAGIIKYFCLEDEEMEVTGLKVGEIASKIEGLIVQKLPDSSPPEVKVSIYRSVGGEAKLKPGTETKEQADREENNVAAKTPAVIAKDSFADSSYRVGPHDILEISVGENPYLDRLVKVSGEGAVTYLRREGQRVKVLGLTAQEAAQKLKSAVRAVFPALADPELTVSVHRGTGMRIDRDSAAPINPYDILEIKVKGAPYLSGVVEVSEEGAIDYLGLKAEEIKVLGLTVQAVVKKVRETLKENFSGLLRPEIKISIHRKIGVTPRLEPGKEQVIAPPSLEEKEVISGEGVKAAPEISEAGETGVSGERPSYKISPYDILEISVYGEPDLTKTVRVSEEGRIRYPLLGEVEVEGLNVEGVAEKLEGLLEEDYLVDPEVSVYITQYATFSVLGLVSEKGSFELKGPLTLVDALVLAQGAQEEADLAHIRVFRKYNVEGGKEKEFVVDLDVEGKSFSLKPLDRIVVEKKGKVYILGAVEQPGVYYIKEKELSLSDALVFLSGGTTKEANLAEIKVVRKESDQDEEYILDLDTQGTAFILQSQDRIIVPVYGKISIFGQVKSPGRYPYSKGTTAVDAIAMAGGFTTVASQNAVKVIREKDGKKETLKVPVGYILKTGNVSRDVELEEEDTIVVPESWF